LAQTRRYGHKCNHNSKIGGRVRVGAPIAGSRKWRLGDTVGA
jgi:hypothetical protein